MVSRPEESAQRSKCSQVAAAPSAGVSRQSRIRPMIATSVVLRTASRLPAGKTWETFEHDRVPLALRQQLGELASGSFVNRGVNVLAFGLPGTGKTHALCAVAHLVAAIDSRTPHTFKRENYPPPSQDTRASPSGRYRRKCHM